MDELDRDDRPARRDVFGYWMLGVMLGIGGAAMLFATFWSFLALIPLAIVLIPAAFLYWQAQKRDVGEMCAAPVPEEAAEEPPQLRSKPRTRAPGDRAFLPLEIKAAVDRGDWDKVAALTKRMHQPES